MSKGFYEIKKGRRWEKVQASSMTIVNQYCKDNGYSDWRMCGMMSRTELSENKKNCLNLG